MDDFSKCDTCLYEHFKGGDEPCRSCPAHDENGRFTHFRNYAPAGDAPPSLATQSGENADLPPGVWAAMEEAFTDGIDQKSNGFRRPHKQSSTHLSRAAVLDTAKELITGPREQEYGTPQANFEAIAALWNVMLAGKLKSVGDCPISAVDVALCMVAVKMARARVTPEKGDTYVDMAGYAALAAELAGAE